MIMRRRKIEEKNQKLKKPEGESLMNAEFAKYRGKDMFTPKEPYLNSILYDEVPAKT